VPARIQLREGKLMRKKLVLIVAGLIVVGAAMLVASTASAATTITVVEHATTDKVADVGKKGDSPGDLLTFHNKVYDGTDATVVGNDQGYCTRISPNQGSWECIYTTFLKDGSITVETPFYDAKDSVGAITGGTGAYASASGTIDLHCFVDGDIGKCDFVFNIA
jgi:allene oxide cyclase